MPYILAFFRHAPVLESGYAIRTVQEFLGHKDVKTTMCSTKEAMGVRSLVDRLSSVYTARINRKPVRQNET